jgi:DNA primase
MGKCPFHEDSSPSFLVDDKKYHCFGCRAHGNAIDFEMNRTGIGFVEAVEALAGKFNFVLEYEGNSKESEQERAAAQERIQLSHIMGEVTRAYARYLWTEPGAGALLYLEERGFTEQNIKDWELGLSPAGSVLLKMAEQRGWTYSQLESVGLIKKRDSSGEFYDFFRDRIMIPIRDDKGQPVALGGRVFKKPPEGRNPPPKYLNSPETPLFQKSKTLFNLHRARTAIVQMGSVVVVEGYMDCLALAKAGLPNVVAVLGTALTPDHLRKLARLTKRVVLCFDSDAAGREAARRTFEVGFPANLVELQYVSVPSGKDPDEFVKEKGIEAFKLLMDRAMPLALWVCDFYLAQGGSREAQVRKIKSDFVPVVMKNPDPAVREVTLESAAVALGLSSVAALTSGVSPAPVWRAEEKAIEGTGKSVYGPAHEGQDSRHMPPRDSLVQESEPMRAREEDLLELAVASAEEATFLIAFAHATFAMFPSRLQNVLRGQRSDEPMDELISARLIAGGLSRRVSEFLLSWTDLQMQIENDVALVDLRPRALPANQLLMQIRALATLDPENLLESGLESWVRGVLEPASAGQLRPQLRHPANLLDPANLPFVRMTVRDVGVSRSRNALTALLSRLLAHLEVSSLDSEIDSTNRELRKDAAMSELDEEGRSLLHDRLKNLTKERLRRTQKFLVRSPV